ncbi:MAG: phosphoribosylformylglycinamidine synthase subunit PurQ [Nitrospirae bacterium]|nr:phosphoribosylformylglycinamidine synthase subunit PurQ [Nitrospirota bacterium]
MFAIVVFPGSNCDHDCYHVLKHVCGADVKFVWHKETAIGSDVKVVILPGGFSHGDYLRAGAIAGFSPIMSAVSEFAANGGGVIGICNGFQILLEAGLLPGAMLRNKNLKFICKDVYIKVKNTNTAATSTLREGQVLKIPIAHAEGNYYADMATLNRLKEHNGIAFTYCQSNGEENDSANPNGAVLNIAGITNSAGNVVGMMPHPERCSEEMLGNTDGRAIFESALQFVKNKL